MSRLVVRLAVAALVAAAVGLGVAGPAQADTCGTAHGVSLVVDFHQLGGGVQKLCDAGGAGETAWTQLEDVGFQLTPVQRQPGFICRIDGKPSKDQDPCVNTPPSDAYWSLWWSDGKSGRWSYSSQGPGSLKVPDGGYVAMSWQSGSGKAVPGASPTPHPSQPSPSPSSQTPSSHPSSHPSALPASSAPVVPSTGPTEGPTSKPRKHTPHEAEKPKKKKKKHRTATASADAQAAGPIGKVTTADTGAGGSGGLPGWVAPAAVAALFAGVGAVALVRRKRSGGS